MQNHDRFHGRIKDDEQAQCEAQNCAKTGDFRAPRKDKRPGWHRFCLEHVRAYNAAWDYAAGLSLEEINSIRQAACSWERQTWSLGTKANGVGEPTLNDCHDIFSDLPGFGPLFGNGGAKGPHGRRLNQADIDALLCLGLDASASRQEIKESYRDLVRAYHPDMNGGKRCHEEKLNAVVAAYKRLSRSAENTA